jgi:membrane dipeptidase
MITRRKFLQNTLAIGGATALFGFQHHEEWFADAKNILSFDLHCHPGYFFAKGLETYSGDAAVNKTLSEMQKGNLTGAFFSMVADVKTIKVGPDGVKPSRNFSPGEAWVDYKRQVNGLKEIIEGSGSAVIATRSEQLDQCFKEGKVAAFCSCEGGDFLEGDAGRLEEMYVDGIRSVQLVHYHPNELGDLQTESPQHHGLSMAGKEAVKRMNKLGIVIDLAHATLETTKCVASISSDPIIVSHSLLTSDSNHPLARRTISTEHAKIVAQTGGMIGAWPSGLNKSFDHFIDNIFRLIEAVGIDHVGLGTDMDANFKPVFSSYLQMPQWIEALKARGLKEEEVRKVAGGNAQRVLYQIL